MYILKKILVGVLALSTVIETFLGIGALLSPEKMMGLFGITTITPDVLYMACIISWLCLVVSVLTGLATFWVYKDRCHGYTLSLILGAFWLGIGLHLGLVFSRPQHLVLDAAKGLLIIVLTLMICRKKCTSSQMAG